MSLIMMIIGVIKFEHTLRGTMRVVPDKLFGFIEVFVFDEMLLWR